MRRATADRLLEGLKERIVEVNRSDTYVFRVSRAVVFGSYVNNPEFDMLGDLDVGVLLEPKYGPEEQTTRCRMKSMECRSGDYLDMMGWPREEVLRKLRNRSPYISLHPIGSDDEAIFSKGILELPV